MKGLDISWVVALDANNSPTLTLSLFSWSFALGQSGLVEIWATVTGVMLPSGGPAEESTITELLWRGWMVELVGELVSFLVLLAAVVSRVYK